MFCFKYLILLNQLIPSNKLIVIIKLVKKNTLKNSRFCIYIFKKFTNKNARIDYIL